MTHIFKLAPYLLLTAAAMALSGCITNDLALGDTQQVPSHASDRYPITVVNGSHGPKAITPPCGNWSADLTTTKDNGPYENLGCAVQHNIAAEIDNPRTIDKPNGESLKSAEDGVSAVVRQQAAVNTTTMPSNYVYQP